MVAAHWLHTRTEPNDQKNKLKYGFHMEITKTERKGNLKSGRMLDLWEGIAYIAYSTELYFG